jgi:hypothetical protein
MHWIFRNIIICTLLAIGGFVFLFYSETGSWPVLNNHWLEYLLAIIIVNGGGALFYKVSRSLNKILSWNKNRAFRFTVETLLGFVIFMGLGLLFIYLYIGQFTLIDDIGDFWKEHWDGLVKFGILTFVATYVFSLVNFSIFSYNQYANVQITKIRIEHDQLKLQFEALKQQLSPHFLFNSLNTISSLIYKDIKLSEVFIRKLAVTYQYILNTNDQKLIKLDREIEMVKAFYFMQKIKYEECVELEINLAPELYHTLVPPLAIQMLVENAFKHNLIDGEKQLKIEIYDEQQKLIVVRNNCIQKPELLKIGNNLIDRPQNGNSYKIGLKNIQKRYHYFTSNDIEVANDDFYTVKLPVILNYLER